MSSYMPSAEKLQQIADIKELLAQKAGDIVISSSIINNSELQFVIHPEGMTKFVEIIIGNGQCPFEVFIDLAGVDYPDRNKRFELVYQFLSVSKNMRLMLKTSVGEGEPVESIASFYSSANWWEREVWDLFGVYFTNHPDMRRILTDYGFDGFPMRKDFPLSGFTEVYYNEDTKKVVYQDIDLQDNYRDFKTKSPWEEDFDRLLNKLNQNSKAR